MATQRSVAVKDERYSLTLSDAVNACVRLFASGRLPTMSRAYMDVLRAFSRACVLAWTSSYDAACERGSLAFVLTCMRAAFARGRLSTMPCACVAVLRSFSRTCVLRAYVCGRIACLRGRIHAYVPSILHVSSFDFVSVPDRYINKVCLIITAINIHILMYLIKGTVAKVGKNACFRLSNIDDVQAEMKYVEVHATKLASAAYCYVAESCTSVTECKLLNVVLKNRKKWSTIRETLFHSFHPSEAFTEYVHMFHIQCGIWMQHAFNYRHKWTQKRMVGSLTIRLSCFNE